MTYIRPHVHVALDVELHEAGRRYRQVRHPGRREVGRCRVEGMPHGSHRGGAGWAVGANRAVVPRE
jgi:hypothetical protein